MKPFIPGICNAHWLRLLLPSVMCWCTISNSFAQSNDGDMRKSALESTLPVVISPSPNSTSLTRNISENVDLYTGRLSVDIPLYTLKSRDIELPISLQTTINAHRVNDIGSWTGLGWYLNAGGVITRIMKNLPDEFNGTISPDFNFQGVGFLNLNTAQENYVLLDRIDPTVGPIAVPYTKDELKAIINKGNWNTKNNHPDKGYDLQPDEFFFNFGKYSGKFVFSQGGSVVLSTAANIKITPSIANNKITAFTVLTDDGFKYDFGNYALNAVEETKLSVSSKSLLFTYRYADCFRDVSFTTQNNHTIPVREYLYDADRYIMSYLFPQNAAPENYIPDSRMDFNHQFNQYAADYPTYPSSWYLTKITSPTGDEVTLNYVNNGQLTYVTDRSFNSSSPESIQNFPTLPPTCSFNSPGPFFVSRAEPKQATTAKNFKHYPSFGDYTISKNTITLTSKKLANIVTGLGFKIEFIANTLRPELPGDRRLDKISVQYNGAVIKEFVLNYETIQNNEAFETKNFNYKVPVYLYPVFNGPCAGTGWTKSDPKCFITETGSADASVRFRTYLKSVTEQGATGESLPAYNFTYYNQADLPFRTSLNQDKYGYAKDNTTPPVFNKLLAGVLKSVQYPTGGLKEFTYSVSGNSNAWNGLRIATVSDIASPGSAAILKNYTYGTFQATDFVENSYVMPDYGFIYTYTDGIDYYTTAGNKIFGSETSRVNPESLTKGAAGGYPWVEVSQPDNGVYRIEFYTSADHADINVPTMLVSGFLGGFIDNMSARGFNYPFPQKYSNDWKRGLPKAEYYKTATRNVQSIHYTYDFDNNAMAPGHSLGLQVSKYRIDFGFDWNWMLYGRYAFYPQWQLLKSKAIRDYSADGNSYRETLVENTYAKLENNFQEYLYLRESKMVSNGKNEQVIQRFRYPLDYSNTSDAFGQGIAQLKTKNVFNAAIENYKYIQNPDGSNKRYVGGILNRYHSNKPLLAQTFALQPAANLTSYTESASNGSSFVYDPNYKPALNFTRYNADGRIEEQFEESDAKDSYIWDYNNTYPIAKATNAGIDDIAYTSFETGATGNWILGSTALYDDRSFTGKRSYYIGPGLTRNGLDPNKTYVLSYWAQLPFNTVNVSGVQSSFTGPQINGWEYGEKRITGVSSITLTGSATIDEVRLHPAGAQMTNYLYDPKVGLTAQNDPNNRITYYEYDALQRLKLVKDAYGNIIKTYDYNYKNESTEPMWSSTGEKRCKPCDQNGNYTVNMQQVRQVDINPNSSFYKSERWWDLGTAGPCVLQPDWQTISGPVCLVNGSGFNTGIQRYVQKNMNPCTSNYGEERNYDVANPAACPSNEPVWQPTEEYRCRPCSNPAYFSKYQERKWVDINPVSNRPAEWRETGALCTVPPDWQFTGATRCNKNSIGLPSGYVEKEKRDVNPCSDSYNSVIWSMENPDGSCPPIYPFIEWEDYKLLPSGTITQDIYIRFYYDMNRTMPVSVSNLNIIIVEERASPDCDAVLIEHPFTVNGSSFRLFDDIPVEYQDINCYIYANFYVKY